MMSQFAPVLERLFMGVEPILNQPVIRMPYTIPLAQSTVIPAGAQNQVLSPTDFNLNFEWPFEIHSVKLSQDISHTYRDWAINIQDMTFNQPLMKFSSNVCDLVDENTGNWEWKFPWVMRPKGGGFNIYGSNNDDVNPITVDVGLRGYFLIPR